MGRVRDEPQATSIGLHPEPIKIEIEHSHIILYINYSSHSLSRDKLNVVELEKANLEWAHYFVRTLQTPSFNSKAVGPIPSVIISRCPHVG